MTSDKKLERKLAAIFYGDVAGYSRLTGQDEEGTHRILSSYLDAITHAIESHNGNVVHFAGDAVLADFATVKDALSCAVNAQQDLKIRNQDFSDDDKLEFRIGVNIGDVIVDRNDIYGDGVNIAARLESLAHSGGICISGAVYDAIRGKLKLEFEFLGEQRVKNIAAPVRAYRVIIEPEQPATATHPIAPTELPDKPSIAVLPFENMSGDAEQEYFSDGISEDIITDLSKVSGLFVISRNSSFVYKGKSVNLKQVGRDLGVRYVLEGSVRKAGSKVRITSQLIDSSTDGHVWAERFDRDLEDIFAVQDEVTQKIVSALKVQLTQAEQEQLTYRDTDNLDAYDYLLRGKEYYLRFTRDANQQARQLYEKAIELDPNYATALAELARIYVQARNHGWTVNLVEPLQQASNFAEKAVELNDSLPQARVVLGFINMWKHDHEAAIAEVSRGLVLDPNHTEGQMYQAIILGFAGQPEESMEWVEKSILLNPGSPFWYLFAQGNAYFSMERYPEAIAACIKAAIINPNFIFAHLLLLACYSNLGKREECEAELKECLARMPDLTVSWAEEVMPYKDRDVLTRFINDLREAGLRE
ncbi:MAG: adenylate cyclase [Parasphingorhabdus sp.]